MGKKSFKLLCVYCQEEFSLLLNIFYSRVLKGFTSLEIRICRRSYVDIADGDVPGIVIVLPPFPYDS